jgi:hypothetical protein
MATRQRDERHTVIWDYDSARWLWPHRPQFKPRDVVTNARGACRHTICGAYAPTHTVRCAPLRLRYDGSQQRVTLAISASYDTPQYAIRRSPMAPQRANIGAGATTPDACSCGMTCGASWVCGDRTVSLLLARSPGMTRALSIGAHLSPKIVQDGDVTQRSHTSAWSQ